MVDPARTAADDGRRSADGAHARQPCRPTTAYFCASSSITVRAPDGHVSTREYLRHPGAVMMIPLLDDGRVVLERQFRYPLRPQFHRVPGRKDRTRARALLACAQRELREETGYVARDWTYLGAFHNAIGYSDEKIEVFLARGLTHVGAQLDAGEVLEVFTAPWHEVLDWVRDGTVTDVKTIVGAYWLERFLAGDWRAVRRLSGAGVHAVSADLQRRFQVGDQIFLVLEADRHRGSGLR